jgi:hypothetical protein
LKTPEDARRLLSVLINEIRREQVNVANAKAQIYCVNVLLSVFQTALFDQRLAAIENTIQE